MTSRRQALGLLGAGSALTMAPRSLVRAQGNTVTVTSLGGRWEQSIREHFIPLFRRRTGAEVRVVLGAPPAWTAQIEAQPGRPPLDAVDNTELLAMQLMDRNLVVRLTEEQVPNLRDTPDVFRKPFDDFGASYQYSVSGIFYNAEKIRTPPTTWAEFFDRAGSGEFGRSVSLPDMPYAWTPHHIWHFAVALGGSMENLDPAFRAIARLKPHIVKFWGTTLELERMIVSREVDIGVLWDGRSLAIGSGPAPWIRFARLAPHSLISLAPAQVVRGGNEALAMQWVNTLLDPEPQLEYYKLINFTPTNRRVVIPENMRANVMPLEQGVVPNFRDLARTAPRMVTRWNREIRL